MTCALYFIQDVGSGAIKIGISSSPRARLSQLQASRPGTLRLLAAIPGDRTAERELHAEFAHLRIRGEWFRAAPELAARIDSLSLGAADLRGSKAKSDAHTELARQWLLAIEQASAESPSEPQSTIRARVAARLGMGVGQIENIMRRRIVAVSAADFEAIRTAYLKEVGRQLDDLTALLEKLRAERKPHGRIQHAALHLAQAKTLLTTHRGA